MIFKETQTLLFAPDSNAQWTSNVLNKQTESLDTCFALKAIFNCKRECINQILFNMIYNFFFQIMYMMLIEGFEIKLENKNKNLTL